ncbi:MAG: hypothetical protein GAK28_02023 [Luteibacter sp.]|uniref:hypothetical protein n=1 Tax=Luteibacter sp. TaxID=1886636 RepID=UPI00137F04E1|nr:hypothetical protein [Luteibacter sp.]KAF1007052.1 MAG: hypothetical protein GAK28_02023 [Luteibacter sp.]
MTLFRKSLARELTGRAQRLVGAVTHDRKRELVGATRQYTGHAGVVASRAVTQVRLHPRAGIAIGAGLGVAALTAAWLLARRRAAAHDLYDEHDPTRQRPTDASGNALDGSGEDNPVPARGAY